MVTDYIVTLTQELLSTMTSCGRIICRSRQLLQHHPPPSDMWVTRDVDSNT